MTKKQLALLPSYYTTARIITEYVTLEDEKRKVTYLNPFSHKYALSIADHLGGVVLIGRALAHIGKKADKKINQETLDGLCMWHDAPETRYGDISRDRRKYILINENKARSDEFGALPWGEEIISLIERFEAGGENLEVKLAKDADALYVIATIQEFLSQGIRINNPDQRMNATLKRLSTDEGFALGQAMAKAEPSQVWEVVALFAEYVHPVPLSTSLATTLCIGWMLSELAKEEEHWDGKRKDVLEAIFQQQIGSNELAHDAKILYELLTQKRLNWQKNIPSNNETQVSKILVTRTGKRLAEILEEIDIFDWWNLLMGYGEVTETGAFLLHNR